MVSVIIPTYNRAATIKHSIESVLNQTYGDLEVLIIDDGSTDNTKDIVHSICDHRVHYYYQNNSGACAARNKGIDYAKGDYIAFQDSDDYWYPEKLATQIKAIEEKKGDIIISFFYRCNSKNERILLPALKAGVIDKSDIETEPCVSTQTILAAKSVFQSIRFDPKVPRFQDYEWSLRAAKKYTFYIPDSVLVDVNLQSDSITNDAEKKFKAYQYMIEKYKDDKEILVILLDRLAYFKALNGINDADLLKKKYINEKSTKNFMKYLMARLHIYSLYNRMRRKQKKSL